MSKYNDTDPENVIKNRDVKFSHSSRSYRANAFSFKKAEWEDDVFESKAAPSLSISPLGPLCERTCAWYGPYPFC